MDWTFGTTRATKTVGKFVLTSILYKLLIHPLKQMFKNKLQNTNFRKYMNTGVLIYFVITPKGPSNPIHLYSYTNAAQWPDKSTVTILQEVAHEVLSNGCKSVGMARMVFKLYHTYFGKVSNLLTLNFVPNRARTRSIWPYR